MDPISTEHLTVDELARRAGTTTRTVRAYQTKGLIPHPRKIGRVAYYGPEHLARLQLIERLLSKGYLLSAIADLLRASARGTSIGALLGEPEVLRLDGDDAHAAAGTDPAGPAAGGARTGSRDASDATPAVVQAEALRDQLSSISDRFVNLLRREVWREALDEINASSGEAPTVPSQGRFVPAHPAFAEPAGPEQETRAPHPTAGGGGGTHRAGDEPDPLDEAGALQRELAAVSERFVDLLRREAWRSAVQEIKDSPQDQP